MLSLVVVQVFVAIGLVATIVGFLIGRARRPASTEPVRVVAERPPARWTQIAWIAGTLASVFWPVGVFFAPEYAYHWPAFPDFPDSWTVQVLGVLLSVSGGILFARAAQALGRQMTPAIQVQQGHRLVQEGPYRRIRHPVYTAIITVAAGQSLFLLSPAVAILAVVLVVLANYRAALEEALLKSPEAFGGIYDEYIARTGRFLPRMRSRPPDP